MVQFSYKAITQAGEVTTGVAEAADKFALARDLGTSNLSLVSAESVDERRSLLKRLNVSFGGVRLSEKIIFAKNLAAMIDAGLPLSRGLSVLERQTRSKAFGTILADIDALLRQGKALSDGLAQFSDVFPPLFVAMVKAGEESGRLAESLRTTALQMEQSYQLKRKIRGAMMYPTIVITAMVIVGILMLIFVVPTLTQTFKELNIDLPLSTRIVIAVSDILSRYSIISLAVLISAVVGAVALFRTERGRDAWSVTLLHLPLIHTLVKETNAARTARTLSSLLTSGVDVVSALKITGDVLQNTRYRNVIREAETKIQKGETVSGTFTAHEDLYPPMVGEMVAVGEETGKLPDMLLQIAEFFEGEVAQKTKDLSTIIEPILMIIIGVVVGFFAVSMISPTYSLVEGL